MKKMTATLAIALLCIALLTACAGTAEEAATAPPTEAATDTASPAAPETETPAAESDGEATADSEKITFESTDTKGNTVTDAVFEDYDLTMINVWGTGCVPCIEEMPGLAKFHKELPENVNMLSVCVDYEADPGFAEDVLAESKASFTTLTVSDSLFQSVISKAQALPTTIFVDRDGNVVGEVILGAPPAETDEQVAQHYMSYVNERLGEVSEA